MNPALILKFIGGSVGLTGGITGSIFSSFQAFTKVTIENLLKDDLFSGTGETEWQILKKKLDESKNIDDKKLKLTKLEEIKENNNEGQNWSKLKTWCENKKSFKIKKLLPSSFEFLLLSYVKDFCILTIGEKLTSANQFTLSDSGNETLKTNTGKLNSHSDETNGNLSLEKELESIKSKDSEKEKALLSWCLSSYKKSYKGESDNLWKLADYYCKKTQ